MQEDLFFDLSYEKFIEQAKLAGDESAQKEWVNKNLIRLRFDDDDKKKYISNLLNLDKAYGLYKSNLIKQREYLFQEALSYGSYLNLNSMIIDWVGQNEKDRNFKSLLNILKHKHYLAWASSEIDDLKIFFECVYEFKSKLGGLTWEEYKEIGDKLGRDWLREHSHEGQCMDLNYIVEFLENGNELNQEQFEWLGEDDLEWQAWYKEKYGEIEEESVDDKDKEVKKEEPVDDKDKEVKREEPVDDKKEDKSKIRKYDFWRDESFKRKLLICLSSVFLGLGLILYFSCFKSKWQEEFKNKEEDRLKSELDKKTQSDSSQRESMSEKIEQAREIKTQDSDLSPSSSHESLDQAQDL
jgi:hypothetical protein